MATKTTEHHMVPIIPFNPVEFRKTVKDSENSTYIYLSNNGIMLDEYKKAVVFDYRKKKALGILSHVLIQPTPGQLRDECLLVLHARPQVKDEKIIRDFFNSGRVSNEYSHCIKGFDPDKLRPLSNFLKEKTEDPDPRNVELLAWLIDFEPRPYKFGTDYKNIIIEQELENINQEEEQEDNEPVIIPEPEDEHTKKRELDEEADVDEPEDQQSTPVDQKNKTMMYISGIAASLLLLIAIGQYIIKINDEKSTTAYVCISPNARKYHLTKNCPALKICKGQIGLTTIAKAKEDDKTLCAWEKQ